MRLSLVQYAPVWEDRAASRAKLAELLKRDSAADWIVLPEMALSGFTMNRAAAAWDRADFDFFSELARARAAWVSVGGVDGAYNTAFAFDPDGAVACRYRKRHLFSYAAEQGAFEPGDARATNPGRYDLGGLRVAQAVCYDLRFSYEFWDAAPSVEAYCVIAAWGAARAEQWSALLKARAIENQAFVIGVNRVGDEPSASYAGGSAIYGPRGELVLDCGTAEGVFSADIDPQEVAVWRAAFPALKDRRP